MRQRWLLPVVLFIAIVVEIAFLQLGDPEPTREPTHFHPAVRHPELTKARQPSHIDLPLGPPGLGDRITLYDTGRILRRDAASDRVAWEAELGSDLRGIALLTDPSGPNPTRVYVGGESGVVALDARTGKLAWRSAGPRAGYLFASGGLILTAESADADRTRGDKDAGRWLVARSAVDGAEVFRVSIPVGKLRLAEVAGPTGPILLQSRQAGPQASPALLIDRRGREYHRFDGRRVAAMCPAGSDWLVLTSRDVVRLSPEGRLRWTLPLQHPEAGLVDGGFVALDGGGVVAVLYCPFADTAVRVLRLDPSSGRAAWTAECVGVGVAGGNYLRVVKLAAGGGQVRVTAFGSPGGFVEDLDVESGRSLRRRISIMGGHAEPGEPRDARDRGGKLIVK
jgi:hypothetical protein